MTLAGSLSVASRDMCMARCHVGVHIIFSITRVPPSHHLLDLLHFLVYRFSFMEDGTWCYACKEGPFSRINQHLNTCPDNLRNLEGGLTESIEEDAFREERQRIRERLLLEEAEREDASRKQRDEERRARIEVSRVATGHASMHGLMTTRRNEFATLP